MQSVTMNPSIGAGLDVRVVGGTAQPTSPANNTIWVNTAEPITDVVYSSIQPTAAVGRVWVPIGSSSAVELELTRAPNRFLFRPGTAYQYTSSGWVAVATKIYANGTWTSLMAQIYDNGLWRSALVTGFSGSAYTPDANASASFAIAANYMVWSTPQIMATSGGRSARGRSNQLVDMSKFTKLTVHYAYFPTTTPTYFRIGLNNSPNANTGTWAAYADVAASSSNVANLDVSGVNNASNYIAMELGTETAHSHQLASAYVYAITLS